MRHSISKNYSMFNTISGRCDNCGNTSFKNYVKDFIFLREFRQYDLKYSLICGFFLYKINRN
ncbi:MULTISPECIES: hypothetical protein [Bacillus cereus group]|uniref:hypothetical protein n=1 Tax=Bacillus cereus group TaxID=86661 RepID=UPI0020D2838F|nr:MULTISPECIES: hypothetical protein [Bacillus cereus group]MED2871341.1 hypothetical protein [Bacillus thuringiensis]